MRNAIKGLLFDKDGTLFGFQESWGPVYARIIAGLAGGDPGRAGAIAAHAGFDLATGRVRPGSVLIAGTLDDVAEAFAPFAGALTGPRLRDWLEAEVGAAPMVPAADLPRLLGRLGRAGLRLGVATNDSEAAARLHLARTGVIPHLDFLAGFDSGHGAKPGPGMVRAFCAALGLAPGTVAMVGDSLHDLAAARAAGAVAVAVLTGVAGPETLAPHADLVLPSVAELPDWLGLA